MTELIYCAARNRQYAEIAIRCGYTYGAQLPAPVYFRPEFVDQNWREPDLEGYMDCIAEYKPRLATVLDLERPDQFEEVMGWAALVTQYVTEAVIVIPKYSGAIARLPRQMNGRQVRLGFSVPTSHGGTQVPEMEFMDWPIHVLGGSPKRQMERARYLDVRSADGNYVHQKIKVGQFFDGERWIPLKAGGYDVSGPDVPRMVVELSLPNIKKAWERL